MDFTIRRASYDEIIVFSHICENKNLDWNPKKRTLRETVGQRQMCMFVTAAQRGKVPPPLLF